MNGNVSLKSQLADTLDQELNQNKIEKVKISKHKHEAVKLIKKITRKNLKSPKNYRVSQSHFSQSDHEYIDEMQDILNQLQNKPIFNKA